MKSTNRLSIRRSAQRRIRSGSSQRGTAMIIAIMIMALLAIFVAASVSRVTNEALIMGNDQANSEAYFAAQASLEHMSRNFFESGRYAALVRRVDHGDPSVARASADSRSLATNGTVGVTGSARPGFSRRTFDVVRGRPFP